MYVYCICTVLYNGTQNTAIENYIIFISNFVIPIWPSLSNNKNSNLRRVTEVLKIYNVTAEKCYSWSVKIYRLYSTVS